jgi:hypothetical protein
MWAAQHGHTSIVHALVEAQADVDVQDSVSHTRRYFTRSRCGALRCASPTTEGIVAVVIYTTLVASNSSACAVLS